MFDTGSSDFIVPSVNCTSDSCFDLNHFDNIISSTYIALNTTFNDSYAKGNMNGVVANETLHFAGMTLNNVTFGEAL